MKKKIIITSILAAIVVIILAIGVAKLISITKISNNIKLGNKYYNQGRYREANIVFEKVIKSDKKSVEARIGLFKGYLIIGERKKAEELLKDTITVIPSKREPYLHLAKLYAENKKIEEALDILKRCYANTQENSMKILLDKCKAQPNSTYLFLSLELTKNIPNKLVALLSSPVITYPNNGEAYNKKDLKVTWNSIADASNYFVAVRDLTSGKKIVNDVNVKKKTNYTIVSSLLTNEHNYCVSVGAKYTNGDERWNENACVLITSNISKNLMLNSSPVITFPTCGQTYEKKEINVTWNSIDGADEYAITVLDVTAGAQLIDNYSTGKQTNYRLLESMLTEGHYYRIAVAAKIRNGEEKWAEIGIGISGDAKENSKPPQEEGFSSAVISFPMNGKSYDKHDINVAWNSVKDATEYLITVKDITGNDTIVDNLSLGGATLFSLQGSKLSEGHSYKISVGAKNSGGIIKWSEVNINILAPKVIIEAPEILLPINDGIFVKSDLVLAWNSVNGASEYIVSVTDTSTGQRVIDNCSIGKETRYIIKASNFVEGHSYTLSVAAKDSTNNLKWSSVNIKIISNSVIIKPIIKAPIDGATYSKGDINIEWNKSIVFKNYMITITDLNSNKTLVNNLDLGSQHSYTLKAELLNSGHSYKIEVSAVDTFGEVRRTDIKINIK